MMHLRSRPSSSRVAFDHGAQVPPFQVEIVGIDNEATAEDMFCRIATREPPALSSTAKNAIAVCLYL